MAGKREAFHLVTAAKNNDAGAMFDLLGSDGKHAPGGSKSYVENGKMTGGFALIAYPAEYRSSGVMTFIVGADGIVYEQDLGKSTGSVANTMTTYDPDAAWHNTEETKADTAASRP